VAGHPVQEKTLTATAPQVFSNISPEQYARLMQKAGEAGFNFTGNSGTASQFGVEVAWNYSPETRELGIQCLSTPFFITPETVNARIKGLVEEVVG
jgi:hypothetical protein